MRAWSCNPSPSPAPQPPARPATRTTPAPSTPPRSTSKPNLGYVPDWRAEKMLTVEGSPTSAECPAAGRRPGAPPQRITVARDRQFGAEVTERCDTRLEHRCLYHAAILDDEIQSVRP
jgi:hypothetical protein